MMRFAFVRTTDGKMEARSIPVVPHGDSCSTSVGPGWGLKPLGGGCWQVSPSIRCLDREPDPQDPSKDRDVEVWHHVPVVVGVPDGEPWC